MRLERAEQGVEAVPDGLAIPQNQDEIGHWTIVSLKAHSSTTGEYVSLDIT